MIEIADNATLEIEIERQRAAARMNMKHMATKNGHRHDADLSYSPEQAPIVRYTPDIGLHDFVRRGWHVLEPARKFVDNWHIGAFSEHLEAVSAGQINKLIINLPPGASKSLTFCVFWFAWNWTFDPASRFLFASHAAMLATRDSVKSRSLITSDWFLSNWGGRFAFRSDQNLKTYFENDKTGFRVAMGIGGTGLRGKYVCADDPHEIEKAESDVDRERIIRWWNETMSERGEDDKSAKIILHHRLHPNDLAGDQLARDLGYELLCFPLEYESDHPFKSKTSLGYVDPRTKDGEILDPVRYPPDTLPLRKKQMGTHGVASQFQQRPVARGGEFFKRHWFKPVDYVPLAAERIRYWDKAGTDEGGAFTVGALLARKSKGQFAGITLYDYFIEDVVYGQWSLAKREAKIKKVAIDDAAKYGEGEVVIYMEREPADAGKEMTILSIRNLAGHIARSDNVSGQGDKRKRAEPLAIAAEGGDVWILNNQSWTEFVLDQLCSFRADPNSSAGADFADAVGGAYRKLALKASQEDEDDEGSTGQSLFG